MLELSTSRLLYIFSLFLPFCYIIFPSPRPFFHPSFLPSSLSSSFLPFFLLYRYAGRWIFVYHCSIILNWEEWNLTWIFIPGSIFTFLLRMQMCNFLYLVFSQKSCQTLSSWIRWILFASPLHFLYNHIINIRYFSLFLIKLFPLSSMFHKPSSVAARKTIFMIFH